MSDMMAFPNTVEEFMEQYKITDTEQIYTNGVELVPIFRMKQWFDHETERKKGEWIFNPSDAIEMMFTKPKCSECGFESADGGNFCSNCGSDMRKGEDNDE